MDELQDREAPEDDVWAVKSQMVNFNHAGQRADKFVVRVGATGNTLEAEFYTMTCPECGSDGRYDNRGDVVCENDECAVLIAGPESNLVLPVDSSGSRGFSKDPDAPARFEHRGGNLEGYRGHTGPI